MENTDTEQQRKAQLDRWRRDSINNLDIADKLQKFNKELWWFTAHHLLCNIAGKTPHRLYPWEMPQIYKGEDKDHPMKDTEFLMVRSADSLEEANKAHSDIKETLDWFISQGTLRVIKEWREDDGKTLLYTIEDLECLNK